MGRSEEKNHGFVVENKWYDEWIETNIPDLSDKVAIITGANSGTGFWAAYALASKKCTVVLACRNLTKAGHAKDELLEKLPDAKVDASLKLDNMDLESVRSFVKDFNAKYDRLDLLLNNAGIMAQPLVESKDGFDIQFQTNHLAHFLLTELLWPKLVATPGQSRVVQHSSTAHWLGAPAFDRTQMEFPPFSYGWVGFNFLLWYLVLPLNGMKGTPTWRRYGTSKLCNVLFMKELARKIDAVDKLSESVISTACHPGYAATNLQQTAAGSMPNWESSNASNAQSAPDGSLPLLLAAVGKDIKNGAYTGPTLNNEFRGPPGVVKVGGNGDNAAMAKDLWAYSEECLKTTFTV